MSETKSSSDDEAPSTGEADASDRMLSQDAKSALAEAEQRRQAAYGVADDLPEEDGGRRDGPEPTRYGDWEKKGIAHDF